MLDPTLDLLRRSLTSQFEAALCMLHDCIAKCPESHWDTPIAKYPFWHVAYHTLMFVDCYLARGNADFTPRATGPDALHPAGWAEFDEEYPSRRFTRQELLNYITLLRPLLRDTIAVETAESLAATTGFTHLPINRLELHLYNIRHIMHHTGQLSASLRRLPADTRWIKAGFPS